MRSGFSDSLLNEEGLKGMSLRFPRVFCLSESFFDSLLDLVYRLRPSLNLRIVCYLQRLGIRNGFIFRLI